MASEVRNNAAETSWRTWENEVRSKDINEKATILHEKIKKASENLDALTESFNKPERSVSALIGYTVGLASHAYQEISSTASDGLTYLACKWLKRVKNENSEKSTHNQPIGKEEISKEKTENQEELSKKPSNEQPKADTSNEKPKNVDKP